MIRHLSKLILITLTFSFGLSSCSPIIMGIYGIRKPKEISKKNIIKYSKRFDLPSDKIYELDTAYFSFLSTFQVMTIDSLMTDSLKRIELKHQVKNHYQPLQALYFNKSGKLESFQINCYAGGFPNLNWDRDSILTTFPPKIQAPLDTLVSDSILISFLQPLSNSQEIRLSVYDYVVYVFWSKFMGRQNKRFINFIQENCKLTNEKDLSVIYINMDNAFTISDIW